ncbi:uncharacterized protein LOC128557365 [Mercenaria mercenaria]|uniref:uncharacterized protein LOC128557365 n=1 Tax=Mercenaria mercenaria TaxID=6596 RepID=UPI00234E4630|nr:uncharacterized protein LOC128557365 [Mercenaria mercenaria]
MIKSGQEDSATVPCPWIFLGSFDYIHTSSSGTTSCSAGGNTWDMCTDISSMAFNLSSCSVDVPYSGTSSVRCVDTVPVASENYVTVYNSGTFDGVNTFQFSCFELVVSIKVPLSF